MVPEGWNLCKLKELALVERGKFSVRPRNDPKYYGGHIPFVQTGDVSAAGTFLTEYSQTLNDEGLKVSKLFPKDSILITIAANIGDTAITTFNVACPDSVVAIQSYDNKSDYFWLKNVLETFKEQLDAQATQNAQKNINLQVLKPLLIKTPPLPEQKKIARILSTWDKAIETVERLIENSKAQKKALMQQLLTGKRRLPGFEGEWNAHEFSEIASLSKSKFNPNSTYNSITCIELEHITQGTGRLLGSIDSHEQSSIKSIFGPGDVLFGKLRPYLRKYWLSDIGGVCSTEIWVLRVRKQICLPEYLFYLVQSERFIASCHVTSGSKMPRADWGYVATFPFDMPSLEEQREIAGYLRKADEVVSCFEGLNHRLSQEKQALMQQLLTGKRRVDVGLEQ